ncbi:kinase-like domain-containing protein [Rhizophagus irregularis DAOM 181602=DAOM 197198]|nr:kinase-like domain-containing protein [Rhizophagus irregularis DAOM 181602=DAOM 197198]
MSDIRDKFVSAAITRSHGLTDFNIHNDIHKRHEFRKQTIHNDNTLTKFEKIEAIKWLNKEYDREKILKNSGKKRICENCKEKCLDGYSDIYTADWIGGCYKEWDIKIRQLKRVERPGIQNLITKVVLKKLENIESANQSWFDEAKSHLSISNKHSDIVKCYGITDDSVKTEMYDDLKLNKASNSINSKLFTSKIYQFENLPEPRNATEDEIKVFYSKLHEYNNKDNNKNNKSISKIFKAKNKKLTKMLKKLQKKNDVNNDDKNKSNPQTKGSDFDDDDDEVYHSERQDGSDSLDDI